MAEVHIVNVAPGDCTIIRHNSGRCTVMDICCGNSEASIKSFGLLKALEELSTNKPGGNFRMCEYTSNPIKYLQGIGVNIVHRFILSHPDMDHMDGLKRLHDEIGIINLWDTGYRRTNSKPTFGAGYNRYKEEDWLFYEDVIDGVVPGVTPLIKHAGARFESANLPAERHDGLHILAPDDRLLVDPNEHDDINESSYIIQYNSSAGNIILPGDAHDESWKQVLSNRNLANNCSFLLAPHHGRDSKRSYDFLDHLRPKLTVLGCSPSKHLAYDEWTRRGLEFITSNQAGNIVLELKDNAYDVYIENRNYAEACNRDLSIRNKQGYYYWKTIING